MAKGSDNPFPSVLLVEGTTPSSPSSGDQRLFVDTADHHLKRVNSSGTVTDLESGGAGSITHATATLSADVTMTNANTFYDGPSVSLAAGTWFLSGMAMAYNGSSYTPTLRLWDGTTTYAEQAVSASAGKVSNMALSAIVVLASPVTMKLSMAQNAAGGTLIAEAAVNSGGNVGTILSAIKLA